MAPRFGHLNRELHGGVGLGVVGMAVAVGEDLGLAQLANRLAQISVGRQAIGATVDFGHGKGHTLPRCGGQRASA